MLIPENLQTHLTDPYGRTIDYMRIAVTSACNLRCTYCLRESDAEADRNPESMDTTQIGRIIGVLGRMGIRKIRFTGGEPLLRRDLPELVAIARATPGIESIKLTTNGVLLEKRLPGLLGAGIDGINLSLDTLDPARFRSIARRDEFPRVRRALDLLTETPSLKVKINVLLLRGVNDDEIPAFAELTRNRKITVRFMELQPFDDHQIWRTGRFMGAEMIRERLHLAFPDIEPITGRDTEHYSFRIPACIGSIAIIPAFSRNFCSRCSRLRITAAGRLFSCLYRQESIDLMPILKGDSPEEALRRTIEDAIRRKPPDGLKSGNDHAVSSMSQIGG
jgi:cyclic pyranopterin phosphate synthase